MVCIDFLLQRDQGIHVSIINLLKIITLKLLALTLLTLQV